MDKYSTVRVPVKCGSCNVISYKCYEDVHNLDSGHSYVTCGKCKAHNPVEINYTYREDADMLLHDMWKCINNLLEYKNKFMLFDPPPSIVSSATDVRLMLHYTNETNRIKKYMLLMLATLDGIIEKVKPGYAWFTLKGNRKVEIAVADFVHGARNMSITIDDTPLCSGFFSVNDAALTGGDQFPWIRGYFTI